MVKTKARAVLEAYLQFWVLLNDMEMYTGVDYWRLLDMMSDSLGEGDMDAHAERVAAAIAEGSAKPVGILSKQDRVVDLYEHIEALESDTLKVLIGGDPDEQWRFCEMETKEQACVK